MPLIPEEVLDDIQARADIVELIGRYVPLKRAGRHFKANCPFHKEKTPSFTVNTDKQIFHCFGCGVGGNIFSFLMQHDRLTFPEAVRQIADHVGIRIPEREAPSGNGSHERLVALMEQVCQYFERSLLSPQGTSARAYLKRRGVPESARQAFRVGLARPGWDHLITAAKQKGVSREQLEAAGLAIQGKSGSYDRFRHRLIFPILDVRGRVVGFGGRSLDAQEPKYLNSPETALYSKGRQLFGLAQARDAILRAKTAILVEGYFDCVVLSGGGVPHVVSPLGTAFTPEQVKLLKRYAETVILAFDPDAAGETATLRGIDLLVEAGLHVHIAKLPAGVDPDECLRSMGRERFEELLAKSSNIFDFLVDSAVRRFPGRSSEAKVQAAQFILPTIARIPNAMLRSEYVRLLAERLRLDEAAVAKELSRAQPRVMDAPRQPAASSPMRQAQAASAAHGPERLLTALVLDEPSRWPQVQEQIALDEIADPSLRRILQAVEELSAAGAAASPARVISRLSEIGDAALVTELVSLTQSVSSPETAFDECVRRVRDRIHKQLLGQLREQLQQAQDTGTDTEVQRLVKLYQVQVKGS